MAKKSSSRNRTDYYAPGSKLAPRGSQPPMITMGWVLGGASFAVVLAMIGVYALLCTLFWQNQWEMIFPLPGSAATRATTTPASLHLPYEQVSFSAQTEQTEQAQPADAAQLTAWWIPAPQPSAQAANGSKQASAPTVLYLHGAQQSLSSALPAIEALHAAGAQVLALDYSGFGASRGPHPSEQQTLADTLTAWQYLVDQRGIPSAQVFAFGVGAGASLATALDQQHPLAGLILANIGPTAHQIFEQDARARLLPLMLLAREKFDPAQALSTLATPKLFLRWTPIEEGKPLIDKSLLDNTLPDYQAASSPKRWLNLGKASPSAAAPAFQSFLLSALPKD